MKTVKVLSLFDGASTAMVSLKKAGIGVRAYYASEIDKYAMQVSAKNFPEIMQLGSVTAFKEMGAGGVSPMAIIKTNSIDLLIGGSPCQDLSIAGKDRKGLDGARSGLFWDYVRILNEVKPKYFILENVASMPSEAKDLITETLGVAPIMIDAALVSAQRRKRLFWVGERIGDKYETVPIPLPEDRAILLNDILQPESEVDEKYYVKDQTLKTILEKMRQGKPLAQAFRIHQTDGKGVTLSALGGGAGAKTGLYCIKPNGEEQTKSNTVRTSGRGSKFGDKHNWDQIMIVGKARGKNNGYESTEKAPTLTGSSWQHNYFLKLYSEGKLRVRRLTPIECERLQGLPDNHTEGQSDAQRYKICGNAFNSDVVAHLLTFAKF